MRESKLIQVTRDESLLLLSLLAGQPLQTIQRDREWADQTLQAHVGAVRKKLSGGWREDRPETLPMTRRLYIEMEEIFREGATPLVQRDLLSSRVLAMGIRARGNCSPSDSQVAQCLRTHGYLPLGRVLLAGRQHYIWGTSAMDQVVTASLIRSRLRAIQ